MARIKKEKTEHDRVVKEVAKSLEQRGFDVWADLEGYSKPGTIDGYRPDVFAEKDGKVEVIEVETPISVDSARDRGQQRAFNRWCNRSPKRTCRRLVTKK